MIGGVALCGWQQGSMALVNRAMSKY